jgi:hypothetical protein
MKRTGFAPWLRAQRHRDDVVGDLAQDFVSDPTARDIRTAAQLVLHMKRAHACREARLALREAAREYREQARRPARLAETPRLQLVRGGA